MATDRRTAYILVSNDYLHVLSLLRQQPDAASKSLAARMQNSGLSGEDLDESTDNPSSALVAAHKELRRQMFESDPLRYTPTSA